MNRQSKLKDMMAAAQNSAGVSQTEGSSGSVERIRRVDLAKIFLNPTQHRKYFDPQEQNKLKKSIELNGFQGSILLRYLPTSMQQLRDKGFEYELVYGESRYRAVKSLGWDDIPAIAKELSDQEVHRIRLDENLVRKDLNPIEEVNGLLEVAADELEVDQQEVISLMDMAANANNRVSELNSDVAIKLEKLQQLLDYYQKGTVLGFRGKYHKLQKLPDDIKQAVRESLSWSKAVEIAPIKNSEEREKVLNWAVEENPSVKDIRAKRKELRSKDLTAKGIDNNPVKSKFYKGIAQIKKSKEWDTPRTRKRVEKLIKEIEDIFQVELTD